VTGQRQQALEAMALGALEEDAEAIDGPPTGLILRPRARPAGGLRLRGG